MDKALEDETKFDNLEFFPKLMMISAYLDITKFCMKRCDLARDFLSSEVSDQDSECLGKPISSLRQQRGPLPN